MYSLYLNDTGDLEFDEVMNFKTVTGSAEVAQRLRLALMTNRGEWFLDTDFGVPWTPILGGKFDEKELKRHIIRVLKDDAAVKEINNITITALTPGRSVEIYFECLLVDDTELKETVEV